MGQEDGNGSHCKSAKSPVFNFTQLLTDTVKVLINLHSRMHSLQI